MEKMTEFKENCAVHLFAGRRFLFWMKIRVKIGELVKMDDYGVYLKHDCKTHGIEEVLYPHQFILKVVRYGEDRRPSS